MAHSPSTTTTVPAEPRAASPASISSTESGGGGPSVAACIIGDEILNGKIQDTNTRFLAQQCFQRGLTLNKVEVVGDDFTDIAESIRRLSAQYDLVLTTGGIGPTHDDITYEAIGRTFGQELVLHQPTLDRMAQVTPEKFHQQRDEGARKAQERMALFPAGAKVFYPREDLWVPVASVANVFIFPGIPELFQKMLVPWLDRELVRQAEDGGGVGDKGEGSGAARQAPRPFIRVTVATQQPESQIATCLTDLQARMGNRVKVGSYPLWRNERAKVAVTFVGRDQTLLDRCAAEVKQAVDGFDWTET
ncbi:hypothetical protein IWQ60_010354 [Tieghemiomyces parasiticus]|uniref:MoaB/Mog domain-containing protein n=1 Tax=Tieghemiomyces parasiticus TaxID=78921 RepID=A0A9W7ZQL1_9FUNG|nr:hypothetical protein IWQ60_010354 [Tieghemiomyces parasiticus]